MAINAYQNFMDVLKTQLDDKIEQQVFVPIWKSILEGTLVEKWEIVDGIGRLTLANAYQAANADQSGKTWYLEKEIHVVIVPEKYQMIFPEVKKLHESGEELNPDNKNLKAVWACENHGIGWFSKTYHGVGYSLRWDKENKTIVCDNAHNAPSFLSMMATPLTKTLEEFTEIWSTRGREPM